MSEKKSKNKKKTGLGLAIWILAFLIILIVFLVKQEEIKKNFEKSGATALIEKTFDKDKEKPSKDSASSKDEAKETIIDLTVKSKRPEQNIAPKNESQPQESSQSSQSSQNLQKNDEKSQSQIQTVTKNSSQEREKIQVPAENKSKVTENQEKSEEKKESQSTKAQSSSSTTSTAAESKKSSETASSVKKTESPKVSPASNTLKKNICFVAIDSDGPVVRKLVSRNVDKESPMGDSLKMLLAGPSQAERNTGCTSLIPEGSRLLSASVKSGVAILNFSEEFQFNQFGAAGSLAQLMQVVYTATEYSTVNSVQILIEGKKLDYLTEGVWIGSPLSRNSF